ncbi:hypothetical protein [Kangiella sediminilitoris]|uniref:Uncharacterized protein n=1 Tax=Kangiella sediminilitoris TaxID=1144748 RepID=A0A1B3BE74_9GAMM|nr:hypothetical protein [Kangiella sediminilitoris]AOE51035.1 hypothetical protein KS2013_2331 [Kangiella sediminilitoris]
MKFFTRLLIIVLVLAGLAYGYIWYKNKQLIDDIFTTLKMQAPATYDNTYVSLDGKSVTTGIEINIPGTRQKATIEEIRFGTDSLLQSFKLVRSIESGQYLESSQNFSAEIKQLQLPLTTSMESNDDSANQSSLFSEILLAGCDGKRSIEVSDLLDMGYQQVTLDFSTAMTFDKHINQANLNVYMNAGTYGSINIDFLFDQLNPNAPIPNPKLKSIKAEVLSSGFTKQLTQHCAKLENLELAQYYPRHMDYLRHVLYDKNLHFSDEFYATYNDYIKNPRSVRFESFPSESIYSMELVNMSAQRMVSVLNLRLFMNDKRVQPLFGNPPLPSELPELDQVVEIEDDNLTQVQGLTLQDTDPETLASYVGYDARFDYRGKPFKGKITSVSGSTVRVNTVISSGNYLEMPFRVNEINNLKVRREVKPVSLDREEVEPEDQSPDN